MKLYLVRHGDTLPKEVDSERRLSDEGKDDVARISTFLAKSGVQVSRIYHSGKKRAEQTALLLQSSLRSGGEFGEADGIASLDPVDKVVAEVRDWQEDTMLVGHIPFMGKLVSRLVAGKEALRLVKFQPGSVVCLEREETGDWIIAWMIRPEVANA